MSVNKMIAASAVGAAMLSSGALAAGGRSLAGKEVREASARCHAVSIGYSEVSNNEAIAEVTADAAAYICNGETDPESAHAIAEATASAFALAVAEASAQCELKGDAHVRVDAHADAVAAAEVWLSAYASAWAGAGDCEKCDAHADSYVYIEKEVFLYAVAQADVKLEAYSSEGRAFHLAVFDYQRTLKEVVVTAYAEAIAGAAKYTDENSCWAWVNAGGCAYNGNNADAVAPNCEGCEGDNCIIIGNCEAMAVSYSDREVIDAVADAAASAVAWTCGDSVAYSDLEVTAHALAEATAYACSYALSSCEVDGGWSCAFAATDIEQAARATATAYAGAWADAYTCDNGCEAGVDEVADAVGDILVEVATSAFASACADEEGSWTEEQLVVALEEANMCALATAHAYAISSSDFCLAGGIIFTAAEEGQCPDL